jgi:hypothetical protein
MTKAHCSISPEYERHKRRIKARNIALTRLVQDIAPCPPPKNLERRIKADLDFKFFCETYFPRLFTLAWSSDHLKVIEKIERAVLNNETFAVAMPRGSGKTTLCQVAVLWAILIGKHQFVFLVASSAEYANDMLTNIKSHLTTNDLLLDDYPEAIYPIRKLEGESRRCGGQRYYGALTAIGWKSDELVMPTIPGSRCAGAIIRVAGITGNIRGATHARGDGYLVRPTLAIIDDPQTDQSARSLSQVDERLKIINGAVAGLAGPKSRVAMIMPCTVVCPGDLADQVLNREKNPQWQGERTKLIYKFPTNEKLWDEYAKLQAESYRIGDNGKSSTEFYRQNQAAMDEGAEVAWAERHNPDEVSAIQYAMNLKLKNEAAFQAEYQNEPMKKDDTLDNQTLSADDIAAKVNGIERRIVPLNASMITAMIDVQKNILYWTIVAWSESFDGWVLDYGTFPEQRQEYFSARDARFTLQNVLKNTSMEGCIFTGLERALEILFSLEFFRQDGAVIRINQALVDANWGDSTEIVYQICRTSKYPVLPSHGKYIGASGKPMSAWTKQPGDKLGLNWRIPNAAGKRAVRHVVFDTNFWKSFINSRLMVRTGDPACLTLYGRNPHEHRLFAEHLTAEFRVKTFGRGRVVDEWKQRPNTDNHWFDCLVGCAVAANLQGASLSQMQAAKEAPKKRISLAELQRRRRSEA